MSSEEQDRLASQLSAYLDDALSPEERARVESRLAEDAEARALLDELRATVEFVAQLPRAKASEELLEGLRARMEKRALLDGPEEAAPAQVGRWRLGRLTAAAAMIGLAFIGGYLIWPPPPEIPTADVSEPHSFAWRESLKPRPGAPDESERFHALDHPRDADARPSDDDARQQGVLDILALGRDRLDSVDLEQDVSVDDPRPTVVAPTDETPAERDVWEPERPTVGEMRIAIGDAPEPPADPSMEADADPAEWTVIELVYASPRSQFIANQLLMDRWEQPMAPVMDQTGGLFGMGIGGMEMSGVKQDVQVRQIRSASPPDLATRGRPGDPERPLDAYDIAARSDAPTTTTLSEESPEEEVVEWEVSARNEKAVRELVDVLQKVHGPEAQVRVIQGHQKLVTKEDLERETYADEIYAFGGRHPDEVGLYEDMEGRDRYVEPEEGVAMLARPEPAPSPDEQHREEARASRLERPGLRANEPALTLDTQPAAPPRPAPDMAPAVRAGEARIARRGEAVAPPVATENTIRLYVRIEEPLSTLRTGAPETQPAVEAPETQPATLP